MADKDPKNALGSDLKAGIANLKSFTDATEAQNAGLKESINLLKDMQKSYDKIADRVSSMNKATINTNRLEKELEKTKQQQNRAARELVEYEKEQADTVKMFNKDLNAELLLQQKINNKELEGAQLKKANKYLRNLQNDLEYQSYKTSIMAVNKAKEEVAIMQERIEEEKAIADKIGFTGNLLKQSNKYLGIGGGLYGKIVQEARDGEVKTKGMVIATAALASGLALAAKAGGKIMSGTTDQMSKLSDSDAIQKMTSGVSGLLKNIPFVGGLLGGMVDSVSAFLDLTISASSKVQKMGRELGLSSQQALALNNSFNRFANSTNDALLNSQKLFETQIELGNQLGVLNTLSNDRLQTDIHLKEIAGLDLQTRGSLVESSVILGQNQKDIMNSVFAQVKGLKQATGIQLDQKGVLKEASNLGGYLGLSFAKYPAQLTKSLISIKAMGLELKQLDGMASSFLDFESSISSEFEAQLLTGKDINLMKARELFLNNDLAGAAQEITSQVGSSSDFMKMNRIQAESLAKAMGMTRDQMGDMLKKQEYMSKIGAKDTDNAQKQYQLALAKYGTQKEMSAMLGEDTTNAIMNASAQEKIAGLMDKIKQGFVDLISNSGVSQFIDKAINWISKPENIQALINKIQGFFATVMTVTGTVVGGIMKALNYLPGINIDKGLIETVSNLGRSLGTSTIAGGGNLFSAPATVSDNKAKSEGSKTQVPQPQNQFAGGASPIVNLNVTNKLDPITGKSVVEVTDVSYSPNLDKTISHTNGH